MKSKKKIRFKSDIDKNQKKEIAFYRIIFFGDGGVGKTQIINIYNKKLFQNEHFPTFSLDFQIKTININGKKTNIHCIDTEGSSKDFSEKTGKSFIKKADAFILVYDITSVQSFNNLYQYYDNFKFALNDLEEKYNQKFVYIVGNKLDLRTTRAVNENDAINLATKYNAKYIECSAKNGYNVDRLFEYIIQDILKREENNSSDSGGNIKNNNIYRNIMSLKSNETLRTTYRNGINTDNESNQNFITSSYFLKSRNNINTNNDYINNINNFQRNQNNDYLKKSLNFYENENKPKLCYIF